MSERRGPEPPDISEKGGMKNGQPQRSDERLFMQLLAFGGCADALPLADALARAMSTPRCTKTSTIRAASRSSHSVKRPPISSIASVRC